MGHSLDDILRMSNGYLQTSEAIKFGHSKQTVSNYVKKK